jgi:hypothetical protein
MTKRILTAALESGEIPAPGCAHKKRLCPWRKAAPLPPAWVKVPEEPTGAALAAEGAALTRRV